MQQQNSEEQIIMKNILFLAEINKNSKESQRNLLNKWFQDSIKNYILESIASPLIADNLQIYTSSGVKAFIRKQLDKNKPKYMGIMEQYFKYISKYNQKDLFQKNIKQILMNPVDITHQNEQQSYNTLKTVRKQFVCLLIQKYFDVYRKQEIASFYELWNICFPQEAQTKKKLSKYDKLIQKRIPQRQIDNQLNLNNSSQIQSSFLTKNDYLSITNQSDLQDQQELYSGSPSLNQKKSNSLDQSNLQSSKYFLMSQEQNQYPQKQPINNRIFEEDIYQQESMSEYLKYYYSCYDNCKEEQHIYNQNIQEESHLEYNETNYQ
ncbi:hypothetical protein ABPG72_002590 [Tetrahymena utriculariae]